MKLPTIFAAAATAWVVLLPSSLLAAPNPQACNNRGNPPFCAHAAPEIDAASGLAAIAAVLAGLALAREWRTRSK